MPPLNTLKEQAKPQPLEMDSEYLRENLSQQELVQNGRTPDTVVVGGTQNKITKRQLISVTVLCFVNLINYMDRYTVAGLLVDISKTFSLTESQEGLLQTAFILVYMVMAPLFGYLGDRFNRRILMTVGVFLWSLTTLIGSFMQDYKTFLIMRCFVGVGEASYSTIAPTIISDIFISDTRSKMLALFYFAIPVGSGLGYIIGAEVGQLAHNLLPDDQKAEAWRWGLRVTPIMGLIAVILIMLVLIEPPRGEGEGAQHLKPTSFLSDLKHLFTNRSFVLITIAFTCVTYVAGALAWWGPKYVELGVLVQEDANVKKDNVAFIFGVVAMMGGLIGVPFGSFVGQRLRTRFPYADAVVCGFGLLLSAPLLIGAMLLAGVNSWGAFVVVLLGQILLNLNWAVVADIVLYVVLPTRRSSAEAFQILISHAFGDAGSPYVVGLVTEALKPLIPNTTAAPLLKSTPETDLMSSAQDDYVDFKALQYSLIICSLAALVSAFFFFWSALYITKDKNEVERVIAEDFVDSEGSNSSLPQPRHRYADETDLEHRHHLLS